MRCKTAIGDGFALIKYRRTMLWHESACSTANGLVHGTALTISPVQQSVPGIGGDLSRRSAVGIRRPPCSALAIGEALISVEGDQHLILDPFQDTRVS